MSEEQQPYDGPTAEDVADEDFAEVEDAAVPMYAISKVAMEEIERALIALGINVGPGVINTINPTASRAMGFIRAARDNGPIPSDATLAERDMLLQQAQRQRDFLTGQIDSLIRRVGAALVAAGVMDANAMEGFILKETLPLQHALAQIGQQP